MNEGIWFVLFLLWCVFAGLGFYVALQKGRPAAEGLILGFLFGPLGCLIVALLPAINHAPANNFALGHAGTSRWGEPDDEPDETMAMEYLGPPQPPGAISLDDLADGADGIRLGIKDGRFVSGKTPRVTPRGLSETEEDRAAREAISGGWKGIRAGRRATENAPSVHEGVAMRVARLQRPERRVLATSSSGR